MDQYAHIMAMCHIFKKMSHIHFESENDCSFYSLLVFFQWKIFILTFGISVCGITFRFLLLGTEFMARLHEHLKYFVNMKISTDKSWQGVTVYLSGHEVNFYINNDFLKLIFI